MVYRIIGLLPFPVMLSQLRWKRFGRHESRSGRASVPRGGLDCFRGLHRGLCVKRFHQPKAAVNDLPQDWTQVVSWCRCEFQRCVSPDLPDSAVHLAKCCLLVALEEEAARSAEAPHPELQELLAASSARLRPRSAASASTWSGERLEALAAEVASLLDQQLEESALYRASVSAAATAAAAAVAAPATVPAATDAASGKPNAAEGLDAQTTPKSEAEPDAGSVPAEAEAGTDLETRSAEDESTPATADTSGLASVSFDFAEEQEQLLQRIHTSQPGAVGSSSRGHRRDSGRDGGRGGDGSEEVGEQQYYGSAWPSRRRLYGRRQSLYRRYPIQTLAAVNTVLFDRHGYQPCNRYGVPSDHQLAAVLERGVGASAALSILYLEVCERLGFPLAARPLEDGRYFVLWPVDAPLTADGQRFLVDPYGRGGLLLLDEVCEIFGVAEADLQPASRRELLAALLGELRDSHWAAAAGCSPLPASMTPLSAETALNNKVVVPASGVCAASLRRAIAAAEKRVWLLPNDGEAQLQYGLLLYFSRRYDDAWIELALYLERFVARGGFGALTQQPQGQREVRATIQETAPAVSDDSSMAAAPDLDPGHTPSGNGESAVRDGGVEGEEGIARSEAEQVGDVREEGAVPGGTDGSQHTTGVADQVALLVERIRLILDFAPSHRTG